MSSDPETQIAIEDGADYASVVPISLSPPTASTSVNPKSGKKIGAREAGSSLLNSVNKSASKIRKHPLRKSGSPINWHLRKKGDSFLQRKIKRLQEVGGMNESLDETLCGANLHYSKIAREKIAAEQAANRAMEARKAAMVEASWCRILKAARIHRKEAEEELDKAERRLSEAIEAAVALGVMMYDKPDSQRWSYEMETSTGNGGRSTHTITTSFETVFEVDREVAAAVKQAFRGLANWRSSDKDEFKDLACRISENPADQESSPELPDAPLKLEPDSKTSHGDDTKQTGAKLKRRRSRAFRELVDMMHDRLKCLRGDELSSLATIVATCGLNAALHENGICAIQGPNGHIPSNASKTRRYSIQGLMRGHLERGGPPPTDDGLEKVLVRRLSRFEREVHEARTSKKNVQDRNTLSNDDSVPGSDSGSRDVRAPKESREMKKEALIDDGSPGKENRDLNLIERARKEVVGSEKLEKVSNRPANRLERMTMLVQEEGWDPVPKKHEPEGMPLESLDRVLSVRHVSRLEKEKLEAIKANKGRGVAYRRRKGHEPLEKIQGSLDEILVKRPSRLEGDKMDSVGQQEDGGVTRCGGSLREVRERELQKAWGGISLGNLKPSLSRLEREKAALRKAEELEERQAKGDDDIRAL